MTLLLELRLLSKLGIHAGSHKLSEANLWEWASCLPEHKASTTKDHCKKFIKLRPLLLRHLLHESHFGRDAVAQNFRTTILPTLMHIYYEDCCFIMQRGIPLREGAKRKVFARDPIFGGSCVPKPLLLKDSNITGMPQVARKIKRAKIEVNKETRSIKSAKIGVHSTRTGKMWVKIGVNQLKWVRFWRKWGTPCLLGRVMGPNRHNMENYGEKQSYDS